VCSHRPMVCRHMSPKPQRDRRHSVVAAAAADGADGLGHVATEPEREPGKRAGRCVLTPPDGWCVLTPSEAVVQSAGSRAVGWQSCSRLAVVQSVGPQMVDVCSHHQKRAGRTGLHSGLTRRMSYKAPFDLREMCSSHVVCVPIT